MQLQATPSSPIITYTGEEDNTHLNITSLQLVVESEEVFPAPPLLQTK